MTGNYVLDGHEPRPEPDLRKWGAWWDKADRHVARDTVGDIDVSTVFLGIDHGWRGRPVLFETMLFGGSPDLDESAWRYSTWDEAAAGHEAVVAALRAGTAVPA